MLSLLNNKLTIVGSAWGVLALIIFFLFLTEGSPFLQVRGLIAFTFGLPAALAFRTRAFIDIDINVWWGLPMAIFYGIMLTHIIWFIRKKIALMLHSSQ